ncbi:toxin-antitoxin system YwqK family antitoxin [Fulvivirga sp. M361]|uniref:toxin-antitoxin system YwqK family antitoxin n=1 Tax=Fulvivirga sp. M361 TaxID=2594266 RepID=UPI00117A0500|nr:toxin-antitoxin system YwqK family antitoxin [Fulvivirga sp. M361]TRX48935.1 toxin-antitoxin system YwqK family antitoxin [Fulvivirga sp. M361]
MRKLFLIPFIFIACNQTPELSDATIGGLASAPEGSKKEPYEDNPDLVRVTLEKTGGGVMQEGNYLNGKLHGTWTVYHLNELVKSMTTYVAGVKEGTHLEIDDRGRLTLKAHYHNNQYHGDYIAYKNIRVVERRRYDNGQLEGTVKKYYDNGNIMEESLYANGKLNGVSKWYDQEGNVTLEYKYEDGALVKK